MFWRRYANLCEAVGKAPNVVAAEVGVKSSGTVTGWKNGAIPRPSVLAKLAEYFGVSVYELTGEKKEKPIPEDGDDQDRQLIELMKLLSVDQKEFLLAQLLTLTRQGK